MRHRRETPWKTEAALCATFTELAAADGWTVYPECSGWDLLAVKDGIQVGIEAKLKPNLIVLGQAAQKITELRKSGPDYVGVLVPYTDQPFDSIARMLGIMPIYPTDYRRFGSDYRLTPSLPRLCNENAWIAHTFPEPCWTPPYVADLPAGVPSPVVLTRWKIEAVRLCVLLRSRGYLTSADFKAAKVSPTYWIQVLLTPDGREGKLTRYVARPGVKLPDEQHPDIAARMAEELADRLEIVAATGRDEPPIESNQTSLFAVGQA